MKNLRSILKIIKRNFSIKTSKKHFSKLNNKLYKLKYPLSYYLIIGNATVYFLYNSYIMSTSFLEKNFLFSKENLSRGRFHTLITHSFTNLNLFQLLFSSAGIYYIGKNIEMLYGPRLLLNLYIGGAVIGALTYAFLSGRYEQRSLCGARGSLTAMLTYCILDMPYMMMLVFPFPFPI